MVEEPAADTKWPGGADTGLVIAETGAYCPAGAGV
jgi:hypothetical protein